MRKHVGLTMAIGIVTASLAAAAVAYAMGADSDAELAQTGDSQDRALSAVDSIPTIDELLANAGDTVVLPSGQEVRRHVLESFATPSLCGGLNVGRSNVMSATLEARGLSHRIPSDAADRIGELVGSYCASDELAGTVALVLIAEDRASGVALSNDQEWLDSTISELSEYAEIPSGEALLKYVGTSEANGVESTNSVEIASLLKG